MDGLLIYDQYGELLIQQPFSQAFRKELSLRLKEGVYTVCIQSSGGAQTKNLSFLTNYFDRNLTGYVLLAGQPNNEQ